MSILKNLYQWSWDMARKYERFIKFCMVGSMNALLSILIYNSSLFLGLHYAACYTVAFILTVLNSFYWNRTHVFKVFAENAIIKFFTVYVTSYLIGNGVLIFLVQVFDWNKSIAQLPVIAIGTIINYTGSRLWVFK